MPADAKKLAAAGAAGAAAFATAVARFLLGGGVARHASAGSGSCGEAAENYIGAESRRNPLSHLPPLSCSEQEESVPIIL